MENLLHSFFKRYGNPSKPVLLGLSGGPDSLALFTLLLKYKNAHTLNLAVAHIDHQWREESGREAQFLREKVEHHGLSFHLKTLQPGTLSGNLEACCRQERLAFFRDLCQCYGYQAVFLGHHADDQAETVLKRLLEGASGPYLSGLRESTHIEGVTLWRPFLQLTKKEILTWLERQNLKGFEDKTNRDPTFMRGRMRTHILPLLGQAFGKQVHSSLVQVGEEAAEWRVYLDDRLAELLTSIEECPWGFFLELNSKVHRYEIKYLLRRLCEKMGGGLSRSGLETAADLIQAGAADKQVGKGAMKLYIDRGRLFLPRVERKPLSQRHPLKEGTIEGWRVQVTRADRPEQASNWKAAWRGECSVWLPDQEYTIGPAQLNACYTGSTSLAKWWTDAKVPAYLRRWVPVICDFEGNIRHEFLTGVEPRKGEGSGPWHHLQLSFC